MSLDDLEHRLEQYESHLRETRLLLAQQKHRRAETPEETLDLAAKLLEAMSMSEADTLAEQLGSRLRYESAKRTQAIRARQQTALEDNSVGQSNLPLADWERRMELDPPDFGSRKLYGDDDEAAGNAPVPAFPKRPVPVLAGGAARRFEESDEPPRNP